MGLGEFLPSNWLMDLLASVTCSEGFVLGICESGIVLMCGFDEAQLNRTLLETITHHTPAGSSTRYNLDKYYYKIVPIIDAVNMHFGICTLRKN